MVFLSESEVSNVNSRWSTRESEMPKKICFTARANAATTTTTTTTHTKNIERFWLEYLNADVNFLSEQIRLG